MPAIRQPTVEELKAAIEDKDTYLGINSLTHMIDHLHLNPQSEGSAHETWLQIPLRILRAE